MQHKKIITALGQVAVSIDKRGNGHTLVFLHGVFLDKSLWAGYESSFTQRTHIYIDMPAHGDSSNVDRDWSLDECVTMLRNVLDVLEIKTCIAVGHSWGSMIALRTAIKHPDRFQALCFFNMPFKKTSGLRKVGFQFQKILTGFQKFYAKQAAKALYSDVFLKSHPDMSQQMQERLAIRPGKEIARVIDAVILDPDGSTQLIQDLKVPAISVVGETDYVGIPPKIETMKVTGGHISPHEAPAETRQAIKRVIELAENGA